MASPPVLDASAKPTVQPVLPAAAAISQCTQEEKDAADPLYDSESDDGEFELDKKEGAAVMTALMKADLGNGSGAVIIEKRTRPEVLADPQDKAHELFRVGLSLVKHGEAWWLQGGVLGDHS